MSVLLSTCKLSDIFRIWIGDSPKHSMMNEWMVFDIGDSIGHGWGLSPGLWHSTRSNAWPVRVMLPHPTPGCLGIANSISCFTDLPIRFFRKIERKRILFQWKLFRIFTPRLLSSHFLSFHSWDRMHACANCIYLRELKPAASCSMIGWGCLANRCWKFKPPTWRPSWWKDGLLSKTNLNVHKNRRNNCRLGYYQTSRFKTKCDVLFWFFCIL